MDATTRLDEVGALLHVARWRARSWSWTAAAAARLDEVGALLHVARWRAQSWSWTAAAAARLDEDRFQLEKTLHTRTPPPPPPFPSPSSLHTPAPSQSYPPLPSSIPRVSLCRVFPPGGAGSGTPHPPNTKPCVILFTNPSNVPQAEEGTRCLLSLARETRPQPPRSSVRPSQPPAASSRCGSLPSGKSCRWDGMPSRCCRRGVWAIGQPLLPLSLPPPPPPTNPIHPAASHTRPSSARSLSIIPHLRP